MDLRYPAETVITIRVTMAVLRFTREGPSSNLFPGPLPSVVVVMVVRADVMVDGLLRVRGVVPRILWSVKCGSPRQLTLTYETE